MPTCGLLYNAGGGAIGRILPGERYQPIYGELIVEEPGILPEGERMAIELRRRDHAFVIGIGIREISLGSIAAGQQPDAVDPGDAGLKKFIRSNRLFHSLLPQPFSLLGPSCP